MEKIACDIFLAIVRNLKLNGTTLTAECLDAADQQWKESSIDLNLYIENDNGALKWKEGGNFAGSSTEISLESPTLLKASCYMPVWKRWNLSTLEIRFHITNENGELKYIPEDLSGRLQHMQ